MKINSRAIRNADELKTILEFHLPIGKAEITTVQVFLQEQDCTYSDLYKKGDLIFDNMVKTQTTVVQKQVDAIIGCKFPGPNPHWHWPGWKLKAWINDVICYLTISSDYLIRIYFLENVLVEITAEQVFTGL